MPRRRDTDKVIARLADRCKIDVIGTAQDGTRVIGAADRASRVQQRVGCTKGVLR